MRFWKTGLSDDEYLCVLGWSVELLWVISCYRNIIFYPDCLVASLLLVARSYNRYVYRRDPPCSCGHDRDYWCLHARSGHLSSPKGIFPSTKNWALVHVLWTDSEARTADDPPTIQYSISSNGTVKELRRSYSLSNLVCNSSELSSMPAWQNVCQVHMVVMLELLQIIAQVEGFSFLFLDEGTIPSSSYVIWMKYPNENHLPELWRWI